MKPAPFKYVAAASIEEALAIKAQHGDDARFLAGGQSLVPALNFRLARPAVLIDINPLAQLAGIARTTDGAMSIGALTRYRALEREPLVAEALPLMHEALPHIAHPQIRNRGTLGGNLAHADPSSEMPAIVLALCGRMRAQSSARERWIDAGRFFVGPLTTTLEPDEMLAEIELPPLAPRSGCCFMEVARRRGDFALMGLACLLTLGADRRCRSIRIALCGAGDTPIDASAAAHGLIGEAVREAAIADAAAAVQRSIDPPGSIHASSAFQQHLAGVLTTRAIRTALERAGP